MVIICTSNPQKKPHGQGEVPKWRRRKRAKENEKENEEDEEYEEGKMIVVVKVTRLNRYIPERVHPYTLVDEVGRYDNGLFLIPLLFIFVFFG